MKKLAVVVLAAGQGTRMKSGLAKVRHGLLGRPLIMHALSAAAELGPLRMVVVVGVQAEEVEKEIRDARKKDVRVRAPAPLTPAPLTPAPLMKIKFAVQREQKGTAHAVMAAMPGLRGFAGDVVVLYGDTPLIRSETLTQLVSLHRKNRAEMTLLTADFADPTGYGRIIRDQPGRLQGIVEEKDCSPEQRALKEGNPGFYCYQMDFLKRALPRIQNRNRQGEYYLTDLVEIAVKQNLRVASLKIADETELIGVNSRWDLAEAAARLSLRINRAHCLNGVTIHSPATVYIEPSVVIGADAVIEPGVRLYGDTVIGPGCVVEAGCRVENSRLAAGVRVKQGTVIESSEVGEGVQIGPMAHLRPGSVIGKNAHLGNFVETKKARIGEGTKMAHLSYAGDAVIGKNVNLGCGFITCNYDGEKKWMTVIEDDVFVGSDSQTVAPVKIGKGAYVGSGTTVSRDVPAGSLALTRAPLAIKAGWVKKKKAAAKKDAERKRKAERRILEKQNKRPGRPG